MALIFHHSCQRLPYSCHPCSTPEGQRGVTSQFCEGEQRPGAVLTCQLSNTASHKQAEKDSRQILHRKFLHEVWTGPFSSCKEPHSPTSSSCYRWCEHSTASLAVVTEDICDRKETKIDHYISTSGAEPPLPFLSFNTSHGLYFHVRKSHLQPCGFISYLSSSSWSHDPIQRCKGCHPSILFFGLFLHLLKSSSGHTATESPYTWGKKTSPYRTAGQISNCVRGVTDKDKTVIEQQEFAGEMATLFHMNIASSCVQRASPGLEAKTGKKLILV